MTQPPRKSPRVSRGAVGVLGLALLLLALLFFGWSEFGLGRVGESSVEEPVTEPPAPSPDARPRVCMLRVGSDGAVSAEGEALSPDDAVAHCRDASEVVLDVAGDAPFGAVDDLRRALEAAGLPVRDQR